MLCGTLVRESKQPAVPVVFPARLHPTCMESTWDSKPSGSPLIFCLLHSLLSGKHDGNSLPTGSEWKQDKGKKTEEEGQGCW